MPSDDYAVAAGGGALKLKGSKVSKKKKKKDRSDLEKNLGREVVKKDKSPSHDHRETDEEREDGEETATDAHKTESERRHEELRKKRLLALAESSNSKPGLLKTHKERVEELNTYLSKLSEHHDMPKIGPG